MSDKQGNVPQFSDYEKELLLDGGWQCSFCERVNANYVGSCACGHNKKDSDLNRLGLFLFQYYSQFQVIRQQKQMMYVYVLQHQKVRF